MADCDKCRNWTESDKRVSITIKWHYGEPKEYLVCRDCAEEIEKMLGNFDN